MDADEPCHLVEASIDGYVGELDVGEFTQDVPGQPRENWQVPWDERVLDPEGKRQMSEQYPSEIVTDGKPFDSCSSFTTLI